MSRTFSAVERVAHQTDAENLARQGSEAAGDFDAVFIEEALAHFGVVDAVGHARRIQRPQPMSGGDVHAQAHGFDSGDECLVIPAVALPAILQAFFWTMAAGLRAARRT